MTINTCNQSVCKDVKNDWDYYSTCQLRKPILMWETTALLLHLYTYGIPCLHLTTLFATKKQKVWFFFYVIELNLDLCTGFLQEVENEEIKNKFPARKIYGGEFIYYRALVCAFLSLHSDEADDSAGECGAEPEHSPGQHPETVRGWEEQDSR